MVIAPGDLNLMTAGARHRAFGAFAGKTCAASRNRFPACRHGLPLPDAKEEIDPIFAHTEKRDLPAFSDKGLHGRVVIGAFEGMASPVKVFSDTIYVDLTIEAGRSAPFAAQWEERALYILEGEAIIAGDHFASNQLLVFRPGDEITVTAGPQGCHIMLFGGAPHGFRAACLVEFSFPLPRSGSNRPRKSGARADSTSCPATKTSLSLCRER